VEITAKETVSSVSVTVAEVSAPASISPPVSSVSGSVYRYIDITPSTTASNIQAGKIKFKVAKSWLNTNNIEETTVRLNRLVGTTWAKLSTTKVSEDGLNIYYEAVTPGFSTFAISGEKKSAVASAVCGNSIVEAGEDCDSTIGSHTCESLGFSSGTLKCTNCRYDTSGCNAQANPTPVCGNNIIEAGEDCDGTSITETCASKGFQSGSLKCNSSCKFDKSECISRSDAGYNPPGGEGVGGISYMSIVYVIVALIIIAGAGYWHYNKKPSKSAQ
jgi:PGF-pre-PGF domain-containing protein